MLLKNIIHSLLKNFHILLQFLLCSICKNFIKKIKNIKVRHKCSISSFRSNNKIVHYLINALTDDIYGLVLCSGNIYTILL